MQVTANSHRVRSAKRVCLAVRHSSLSAEWTRNGVKLGHNGSALAEACDPRGCSHGSSISAAIDQCALVCFRFVLDRFRVQAKENEKARIVGAAVSLRIAASGRVLSASAQRTLRVVGRSIRSCERWLGLGGCRAHRHRRGDRDLGALASGHQLERRRHAKGRTRTDSQRTVSQHPPSDLRRDLLAFLGTAVALGEVRGLLAVGIVWLSFTPKRAVKNLSLPRNSATVLPSIADTPACSCPASLNAPSKSPSTQPPMSTPTIPGRHEFHGEAVALQLRRIHCVLQTTEPFHAIGPWPFRDFLAWHPHRLKKPRK